MYRTIILVYVCALSVNCDVKLNISDNNVDHLLRGGVQTQVDKQATTGVDDTKIEDEYQASIDYEEVTSTESYTDETTTEIEGLELKNEDITTIEPELDTTLSAIDNTVYKINDDTTERITKTDTTTQPTTKPVENEEESELVSRIADLDEELETGGQRNPKTENSEPQPSSEKRPFETPRPAPAVSKSTTLRGWLEDSWLRPPAGILVPLRPMALNRALAVWNDLVAGGLNLSDIVIVGYDSNGINWRSRHSLQPTSNAVGDRAVAEALSKLLLKYQGVHTDSSSDGTMRALASAAKLVPYDSALFVITDKGPADPQRLPLALRALVEKRLKVYTVWTNPDPKSEEELQELKNIAKHTEGDVLAYSLQVMDMESSSNFALERDQQWDTMETMQGRKARLNSQLDIDKFETLLVRRGGGEAISLGMPVESGVTALRIHIEGAVEHAVLYPPNEGPQIDLYNATSVSAFSPASKSEGQSPRDIYLVFPGVDPEADMLSVIPANPSSEPASTLVGVWHLSVKCDTCDYRLCVGARARLHFDIETNVPDMLKLRVSGPVASVRESLLVDEYGTELAKLPFNYQPMSTDGHEAKENPISEVEAEIDLPNVKGSKIYVKIIGRDVRGDPFTRLAGPLNQKSEGRTGRSASIVFPDTSNDLERAEEDNIRMHNARLQYNDSNVLPFGRATSQIVNQRGSLLTAVQIGLSSRLYGAPGDNLQLHFEVTNYREQAVRFQFGARGELRFLRGISPTSQTVPSGQTVNIIVSVGITASAQPGARDLITFTAYNSNGLDQVSISAYIYVVNSGETTTDVWAPEVRHNFQGTCMGRQGSDCAQHAWSANIIVRDSLGGLLRLASSPVGIIYDSNFISGTREEVIATYRATCCAPRVMVTAVDAYGNANSYIVDISNYFTPASIAAIVLGVFLAIALIALIIFLIYWCVKRRRESRELPTYSTSSRNVS